MKTPLLVDAHLDLAMNALEWNRDLTWTIEQIRADEQGQTDLPGRGVGTVSFSEMRKAGLALVVGTQIARVKHKEAGGPAVASWTSPAQAWAMTQGQLAWYRAMEEAGELTPIRTRTELDRHLAQWKPDGALRQPIGYLRSLEGADSIITLAHLERAYADGLRAIGPAHYGPGRYAQGTMSTGGLPARGRELIVEMDRLGLILDVTHLSDECFTEAMDLYQGPIWASHHNCRALVPDQRQLSDEQIKRLLERGAVIGAALDGWMIVPGWIKRKTKPEDVGLRLEAIVNHIDHICQLAGNANHVCLGSDLDGAFGREQTAMDLQTIADLRRMPELLAGRGWVEADIEKFTHGNTLGFLRTALKP